MKQLTESEKDKFIKFLLPQAIALDSQGVEYNRAFISTTQGLQELDGFY